MQFIKKIKILFLVLAILLVDSINATSVSDNDGSAFITKAEFDALKSSFQSEIDYYNNNIDSKIDDAIASYLRGFVVATIVDKNQICYDVNGILSPRAGYLDLNFKEGYLNWNFIWTAYSRGTALKLQFYGKDGTADKYYFNEMGIDDIYDKGSSPWVASWTGYVKDKQYLMQSANHYGSGEVWSGIEQYQKVQPNCWGFPSYSDFRWNTENTAKNMMTISVSGPDVEPWGTWGFNSFHNTASRTVYSTTNKNIIITPKSVSCKRFSRLDDVYDFKNCKDPDTTTFRALVDNNTCNLNVAFDSFKLVWGTVNSTTRYTNVAGTFKSGFSGGNGFKYLGGDMYGSKPTNWATDYGWEPYLGFCNHFSDYNQLYTKTYDSYIKDMKDKHSDLNVIKDVNGVEHLALNAGSPVVDVTKDAEVTFDVDFADTSIDYDVWLKMGSFSYTKDPNNDVNLISISDIKVDGVSATSGSAGNSFKIKNGSGKVVAKIPSDGYLFIKWQLANSTIAGGGTYKPSRTVTIKAENK